MQLGGPIVHNRHLPSPTYIHPLRILTTSAALSILYEVKNIQMEQALKVNIHSIWQASFIDYNYYKVFVTLCETR